jgi:hypothetical protein
VRRAERRCANVPHVADSAHAVRKDRLWESPHWRPNSDGGAELSALYGDEMMSIADYVRCTSRLRKVVGPQVASVLNADVSVVLDFHANSMEARTWMQGILDQTDATHVLHVLDVPDGVCLARLRAREAQSGHPFAVTQERFWQISVHFVAPSPGEGFTIMVHSRPGLPS